MSENSSKSNTLEKSKDEKFIYFYCVEGLSQIESFLASGWTDGKNNNQRAYQVKKRLSQQIEAETKKQIEQSSNIAWTKLKLLLNSKQDSIVLAASKLILGLNGYSEINRQQIQTTIKQDTTDQQLREELNHILQSINRPVEH